jgi:hypothetical protein
MAWKARELRRIKEATDQRLDAELADSFPASDVPSILRSYPNSDIHTKPKVKTQNGRVRELQTSHSDVKRMTYPATRMTNSLSWPLVLPCGVMLNRLL